MPHDIHNEQCFDFRAQPHSMPWLGERVRIYASGREALVALIRALALPAETGILVPAFVPEGIIAPFLRHNLNVQLYPLDRYLDPVWDRLETLLDDTHAKLAIMIHYFGLPKPIERFCDICHRHGTWVVEDMAHALPAGSSRLGRSGDFVLYSLPKLLGVPDGAPLVVLTPELDPDRLEFVPHPLHTLYVVQQSAVIAANTLSRRLPGSKLGRFVRRAVMKLARPYRTLMRYFESPNPISGVSSMMLTRIDWAEAARCRRDYALRYDAGLNLQVFERFPNCAVGQHGIFGFPVLVADRDNLVHHLWAAGIQGVYFVSKWDFIPDGERHLHRECLETMDRHFLFPTSQNLGSAEVDAVIDIANQWACKHTARQAGVG